VALGGFISFASLAQDWTPMPAVANGSAQAGAAKKRNRPQWPEVQDGCGCA
jgi:hypothetical protein